MKNLFKRNIVLYALCLCMFFAFLTSCQKKGDLPAGDNLVERVPLTDVVNLSDMNLFWAYYLNEQNIPDAPFAGDVNARVAIYTSASRAESGEFLYDDGQDWIISMETSSGDYILFPRKYVQLGGVSCSVFFDYDTNALHVLITEQQGAGYQMYDCIFDSGKNEFMVTSVYEAGNISFLTSSEMR